jgi:hypothetical protein
VGPRAALDKRGKSRPEDTPYIRISHNQRVVVSINGYKI